MTLVNEAGYLYVHSKELISLNKKLKQLSTKAEKIVKMHNSSDDEETRAKHKDKHDKVVKEIHVLIKKHNQLMMQINQHHLAFAHALQKEHNL